MKITNVELFPVHTPRETGAISQHVIVRMTTDEGIVGLGEMSDLNHLSVMPDVPGLTREFNDTFVGIDPLDVAEMETRIDRYSGLIREGLDLAMYDLRGKALNVPVYELLGGLHRRKFKICYPIFPNRSMEDVSVNLDRVARMYDLGFDVIRFYIGIDLDADERFMQHLRNTYGSGVTVKSLDMSGRWDWETAVEVIERFRQYDFMLVESPCRDMEGKARVREKTGVTVSEHTGSFSQALEFARKGAVDVCNIAVTSGGIGPVRKLFTFVEALGLKCLIGTTQELSIGTAAQAHIGASLTHLDFPSDPAGAQLYTADVVKTRARYEDGYLIVPDGPGLGMELDEEKVGILTKPLSK